MAQATVHKVRPTAHCIYVTSGGPGNSLKVNENPSWLFFDQINNNAKFALPRPNTGAPSTDLSTAFVDNGSGRCKTKTYPLLEKRMAQICAGVYDARPQGVGIEFWISDGKLQEGVAMTWVACASILPHTLTRSL